MTKRKTVVHVDIGEREIEDIQRIDVIVNTKDNTRILYDKWYMTEQEEPCEDEYIKVPKKALKYRTAGMVAYNVEWLKNHFDIERSVICGAQESYEVESTKLQQSYNYNKGFKDCRQAVLDKKELIELEDGQSFYCINPEDVETLIPVTSEPKMGQWIDDGIYADGWSHKVFHCSECGHNILGFKEDLKIECPNCGAKMSEVEI